MVLELNLPTTFLGEHGLTVEGAGPALLAELLGQYEAILKRTSPHIWESMLPGLPRDEIVAELDFAGLEVHEELIVWWTWRNGHTPGVPNGLRNPQFSLDLALKFRERDELQEFRSLPSESWMRIAGEGMKRSIVIDTDPTARLPLVCQVMPEVDGDPPIAPALAMSLCTHVAWKLVAIDEGWDRYDSDSGFWKMEQWQSVPREWRDTGLA